jgi:hypothetical protein
MPVGSLPEQRRFITAVADVMFCHYRTGRQVGGLGLMLLA